MEPTTIIVDDREPRTVVAALEAHGDCHVTVQRLPLGDYLVDDRMLFERKTLPDFVVSVLDGRLFRQASRLAASKRRGVIILEGTVKDIASHGIAREALQGALISVSVIFGIPLLRSLDPTETARPMLHTARQVRSVRGHSLACKGRRPGDEVHDFFVVLRGAYMSIPVGAVAERPIARYREALLQAEPNLSMAQCERLARLTGRAARQKIPSQFPH